MSQSKPKNNPVMDDALKAAKSHIDGFEAGNNKFKPLAGKQLREGDPRAINIVRENMINIEKARQELGLKD